ncbi:DUF3857 domain-containing protein [Acidicapsa dinghuensis]|uniref:DUF3857 domain-containing protein n=1 Tax=Acidicapsa dinghuensis TaxID=2218256 RepID=A0ABW1EE44_9BACT|nr:DUF3857 domain-containing protein [Acidicapsa dinghuensis]
MKASCWWIALSAVVLLPEMSFAGIFGKKAPVPQWGLDAYKTKTPDYAHDANAVILYDEYVETIDAQGRTVEREREAIRILKPQGRGNTCAVGHDEDEKINYFRAWTIGADEKQYQAQDTDFVDVGDTDIPIMLSTYKVKVAHPPAIDVGAVVICESEEVMQPYIQEKDWQVQQGIPVVFEALEIDLPPGKAHFEAWHGAGSAKAVEVSPNHWRWEMRDVHPLDLRDIPSHPEWSALAMRMSVQWGDAAVDGKDNEWKAIGAWVTKLESGRPEPTPEIATRVQTLIAGAPDFYTKLSRITGSIQNEIRYFIVLRGIGGLQAHYAGDIYRNRYGDCKDKTTLLISMLQVAGIRAYYMPVDSRRGVVDPDDPSLLGNHMITAIEIPADVQDTRLQAVVKARDGKRYLIFDPTNERTPAGDLPAYEQGGYGLLAAGDASQVMQLPILTPDASGAERVGEFKLTADGLLTGSVETTRMGDEGGDVRQTLKQEDQKELHDGLERSLGQDIPGVSLIGFKYDEPKDLDKPVKLHYELSAQQYARQAGPLLLVRPRVVGSDVLPSDNKTRTVPIDLEATGHWHDSYDIALPEGYAVDEMPDPVNLEMDFASYHSSVTSKGKTLHYERDYKVKEVELPSGRAQDFRKLESTILTDEKSTVVLKRQ